MKQKVILLISIVAGIAAFWLTGRYLRYEREHILGGAKQIYVIAAARELPAGTILKNDDLGKALVFQSNVGGRAILPESVREIIGKKLLYNIAKLDPLQWSDVDVPFKDGSGLAEMINPSMRAVSISVDAVSSVSAMIKPNDHVDVLGTFSFPSPTAKETMETVTLTVLQDVTVLATGQIMADKAARARRGETAPRGYTTITFEVTLQEAELLVFAQSVKGKLSLALRNSADVTYITNIPAVNFEYIQKHLPLMNLIRQRDIRHKKDL